MSRSCSRIAPVATALGGNVEHVKGVASALGILREQARKLRGAISVFLVEHE
ncbi:hypothetical protein [Paraburkholderia sp. HP33-1]|uniref:hypothetical protein n=1 Tax=Paraburkholderia sp. HP33-1 TaxID=2883243 RepID=UPI001F24C5ED|nr:hypothetical protein [Paraburkholderia sp. HP33-1]